MILECPECKSRYRLGDDKIGKEGVQVKCSKCQTPFAVNPQEPEKKDTPKAAGGEGGVKSILICDDAPFFRALVTDILTEAGYSVETAASGEEALCRIAELRPDALILDLQLPGMNGFEVIKQIRSSEAWKALPILAMSAVYTDSSDIMSLEDIGADDYIGKKFKPEHLVKRVKRMLQSKREPQ